MRGLEIITWAYSIEYVIYSFLFNCFSSSLILFENYQLWYWRLLFVLLPDVPFHLQRHISLAYEFPNLLKKILLIGKLPVSFETQVYRCVVSVGFDRALVLVAYMQVELS